MLFHKIASHHSLYDNFLFLNLYRLLWLLKIDANTLYKETISLVYIIPYNIVSYHITLPYE